MVKNNIFLSYILAFCKNTWFWLGIWVFYYLRFTDYAGIGLIETTLIVTLTLAEIPTGAVADLLGKKRTLIIAFLFEAAGSFMMTFAGNLQELIISVFIMCVGGAFYSGTIDALMYDSLKQDGLEDNYDQKRSNLNTIQLLAPALCGIAGGFLYVINPRFPFLANTIGYLIGLIICFFLVEPQIDTEKFSFANFLNQTKHGFRQLVKSRAVFRESLTLLGIGFIVVICSELLDSFLSVEFGFDPTQLGILWAGIFLVSAFASQLTPRITKSFGQNQSVILVSIVVALTLLVSPLMGLIAGGAVLTLRVAFEGIFDNVASLVINRNTESKFRATTISTFNMIKNLPYIAFAYVIGSLSDQISAKNTAMYLGIILLLFILPQILLPLRRHLPSTRI